MKGGIFSYFYFYRSGQLLSTSNRFYHINCILSKIKVLHFFYFLVPWSWYSYFTFCFFCFFYFPFLFCIDDLYCNASCLISYPVWRYEGNFTATAVDNPFFLFSSILARACLRWIVCRKKKSTKNIIG